jgi:hypothetical protein
LDWEWHKREIPYGWQDNLVFMAQHTALTRLTLWHNQGPVVQKKFGH